MQVQVLGQGEMTAGLFVAESDSEASLDSDCFKILDLVILKGKNSCNYVNKCMQHPINLASVHLMC